MARHITAPGARDRKTLPEKFEIRSHNTLASVKANAEDPSSAHAIEGRSAHTYKAPSQVYSQQLADALKSDHVFPRASHKDSEAAPLLGNQSPRQGNSHIKVGSRVQREDLQTSGSPRIVQEWSVGESGPRVSISAPRGFQIRGEYRMRVSAEDSTTVAVRVSTESRRRSRGRKQNAEQEQSSSPSKKQSSGQQQSSSQRQGRHGGRSTRSSRERRENQGTRASQLFKSQAKHKSQEGAESSHRDGTSEQGTSQSKKEGSLTGRIREIKIHNQGSTPRLDLQKIDGPLNKWQVGQNGINLSVGKFADGGDRLQPARAPHPSLPWHGLILPKDKRWVKMVTAPPPEEGIYPHAPQNPPPNIPPLPPFAPPRQSRERIRQTKQQRQTPFRPLDTTSEIQEVNLSQPPAQHKNTPDLLLKDGPSQTHSRRALIDLDTTYKPQKNWQHRSIQDVPYGGDVQRNAKGSHHYQAPCPRTEAQPFEHGSRCAGDSKELGRRAIEGSKHPQSSKSPSAGREYPAQSQIYTYQQYLDLLDEIEETARQVDHSHKRLQEIDNQILLLQAAKDCRSPAHPQQQNLDSVTSNVGDTQKQVDKCLRELELIDSQIHLSQALKSVQPTSSKYPDISSSSQRLFQRFSMELGRINLNLQQLHAKENRRLQGLPQDLRHSPRSSQSISIGLKRMQKLVQDSDPLHTEPALQVPQALDYQVSQFDTQTGLILNQTAAYRETDSEANTRRSTPPNKRQNEHESNLPDEEHDLRRVLAMSRELLDSLENERDLRDLRTLVRQLNDLLHELVAVRAAIVQLQNQRTTPVTKNTGARKRSRGKKNNGSLHRRSSRGQSDRTLSGPGNNNVEQNNDLQHQSYQHQQLSRHWAHQIHLNQHSLGPENQNIEEERNTQQTSTPNPAQPLAEGRSNRGGRQIRNRERLQRFKLQQQTHEWQRKERRRRRGQRRQQGALSRNRSEGDAPGGKGQPQPIAIKSQKDILKAREVHETLRHRSKNPQDVDSASKHHNLGKEKNFKVPEEASGSSNSWFNRYNLDKHRDYMNAELMYQLLTQQKSAGRLPKKTTPPGASIKSQKFLLPSYTSIRAQKAAASQKDIHQPQEKSHDNEQGYTGHHRREDDQSKESRTPGKENVGKDKDITAHIRHLDTLNMYNRLNPEHQIDHVNAQNMLQFMDAHKDVQKAQQRAQAKEAKVQTPVKARQELPWFPLRRDGFTRQAMMNWHIHKAVKAVKDVLSGPRRWAGKRFARENGTARNGHAQKGHTANRAQNLAKHKSNSHNGHRPQEEGQTLNQEVQDTWFGPGTFGSTHKGVGMRRVESAP